LIALAAPGPGSRSILLAQSQPDVPAARDATPEPAAVQAPREGRATDPASYLRRGLVMLDRPRPEDQEEAQRLLRKAIKADPGLVAAHVALARSSIYLYGLGLDETPERLKTARDEAGQAVEFAPDQPAPHAVLALALAASDRLTPALEEGRRAVELGPADASGHLALCVIERLRGEFDAALASCRRAADLDADAPRVLVGLGEALRESGSYHAALQAFGQAADLDHESALPQLGAAATLLRSGNVTMAAKAYDMILDKFPFAKRRTLQGGAALRALAGDYEGAIELLDKIVLPENGSLPTLLSLYTRGYSLLRLDRAPEAEYFLTMLIGRVPADYDGPARGREVLFRSYDDLADFFEGRGHRERVEALLREAAGRPQAPLRLTRRFAAVLEAGGAGDEAALALERGLTAAGTEEDPLQVAEAALSLARLRSDGGQRAIRPGSQTSRALDRAATLIAADAPGAAYYRMARAFALARDAERSLSFLEKGGAAGYLPVEQAAAEPDFKFLRERPEFRRLIAAPPA
jgi:tetratricopeptide (TPR) repeat protein